MCDVSIYLKAIPVSTMDLDVECICISEAFPVFIGCVCSHSFGVVSRDLKNFLGLGTLLTADALFTEEVISELVHSLFFPTPMPESTL